jgi:hypothetical protein
MEAKIWKKSERIIFRRLPKTSSFLVPLQYNLEFWPIENWTPMGFDKNSTVELWPFHEVAME